jgi:hypothetical protein
VAQPFANHAGGTVAFGPLDGYLYWGLGDGGDAYDPGERAQDGRELLGKLLRVDVSGGVGTPYTIPGDNPFLSTPGTRAEIWALGLRNPYRFAFDRVKGDLWIGEVGQDAREEIDFQPAGAPGGANYGWDVMEGALCSTTDPAPAPACEAASLVDPFHEYPHADGNCSVTGGALYRGPEPSLQGLYFFGDFCSGRIWTLNPGNRALVDRTAELAPAAGAAYQLAAIGEGGFGELYAVHLDGDVIRLGPAGDECSDGVDNDGDGAADLLDGGCASAADASERDPDRACDDGFDNDHDGRIDYPADADCPNTVFLQEGPIFFPPMASQQQLAGVAGGGGGGGGCGLGIELVPLLPLLARFRRWRGRRTPAAG